MSSNLFFVLGGTRSGKSAFAEQLAAQKGQQVIYIATAACLDEEMKRRVKKHQASRPAEWKTIEEQIEVAEVIQTQAERCDVILLDCLTLLVSNLLFLQPEEKEEEAEKRVLSAMQHLAEIARTSACPVIMVSSEVGFGLVPDNTLGRLYRDIIGKANQIIAAASQETYLVVAGIPIALKDLNSKLKEDIEHER